MMKATALKILWPAFIVACALELLVFALVDPVELHGFGSVQLGWWTQAVYSAAFLIFWALASAASAMTVLLLREPAELNQRKPEPPAAGWTQR